MPTKGMRSLCFSPHRSSSPFSRSSSPSRFSFSPSRPSFSESVMDRTLDRVEPMIMKWNPDSTTFAKVTSLFYENRREAKEFIKCVNNLQKAMHFHASENSNSDKLVRAQNLMQIAVKRLQKEFYQILSMNRAHLDPESVSTRSSRASTISSSSEFEEEEDDAEITGDSITEVEDVSYIIMSDLRTIAECMIASGYAKECLNIYRVIRKSIIDEGIYRLGVEKSTSSKMHKIDYQVVELRTKKWLNAVRIAVKTLFNGERILCDHVFAASDSIRESCFADISKESAMILFAFPELLARNTKKSQDKIFRILDMYTSIADLWPEIESIFSFESTSAIRSQAVTSLIKMSEYVKTALMEFETSIQKDSSKSAVAGGGIHHLTIDVMNYLSLLADYSGVLTDILADSPPPASSSLPDSFFGVSDSDDSQAPAASLRFAWLILVLLCKLDGKATHYKDVSLAYLFLANNLQYVVVKVRTSILKYLLGDEWLSKQEKKVKQFASSYERLGWSQVIATLPEDPTAVRSREEVKDFFKRFNAQFDQAYRKQSVCVIADSKLRDDIKVSIAQRIVPAYREFYHKHKLMIVKERSVASVVRFSPDDIGNYLSDLFFEAVGSGTPSSSSHKWPWAR